jgi:hypothetical protein
MINTFSHNPEQLLTYAQGHTESFVDGLDAGLHLGNENPPVEFSWYSIHNDTYAAEQALDNYIDQAAPEIFKIHKDDDWQAWVAGAHTGIAHSLKIKRAEAHTINSFDLRRIVL